MPFVEESENSRCAWINVTFFKTCQGTIIIMKIVRTLNLEIIFLRLYTRNFLPPAIFQWRNHLETREHLKLLLYITSAYLMKGLNRNYIVANLQSVYDYFYHKKWFSHNTCIKQIIFVIFMKQ